MVDVRTTFSHGADAVYIYIAENDAGEPVRTESLDPSGHLVNLDFTESGRLLGIEILEARATFAQEFLDGADQIDVR